MNTSYYVQSDGPPTIRPVAASSAFAPQSLVAALFSQPTTAPRLPRCVENFLDVLKTHRHDNLETCLIVLVPHVSDRKGITGVEDIGLNEERSGRITLACRALTAA